MIDPVDINDLRADYDDLPFTDTRVIALCDEVKRLRIEIEQFREKITKAHREIGRLLVAKADAERDAINWRNQWADAFFAPNVTVEGHTP